MAEEMTLGSYDVIGNIAILPLYSKGSRKIARKLLSEHKNILAVLQKTGKVKGRLRKTGLKFIAGKKKFETIHKESNCLMKLDVRMCYFSPRLSNDRLDIAKQVKDGENVLVMFSGIAPYALVIAKNSKAKIVYAVELNRTAHKYALENIKLNKLNNVIAIQGDAKKIIPKLKKKLLKFSMSEINGKISEHRRNHKISNVSGSYASEHAQKQRLVFDRIIMARPQLKEDFLKETLKIAKKGTIIHFYDFLQEDEMPDAALKKIENAVRKAKKHYRLIRWKKALEIGPRKWRVRVDFIVI